MIYITLLQNISTINKYYTWYINICQAAQIRDWRKGTGVYLEKHHILPKSFGLGGEKDQLNLVHLTAKEHYIVHRLLPRFINHTGLKKKMDYALWYLSNRNTEYTPSSRIYELAKQQLIKNIQLRNDSAITRLKKSRPGKLNGMYGKTHTNKVKEKLSALRKEQLTGKSYEELYGAEKASRLKKDKSVKLKKYLENNPEVRKGSNNANSKKYEFCDPTGIIYSVCGNLQSFCKEHKLPIGAIIDVVKGRKIEYKGWIAKYTN